MMRKRARLWCIEVLPALALPKSIICKKRYLKMITMNNTPIKITMNYAPPKLHVLNQGQNRK